MASHGTVADNQYTYSRAFNSFGGSDIKGIFGRKAFAELQAISYAITREKAPVYTMGQVDPRSFSRNKRAIAGTIVFIDFDRNAMLDHFRREGGLFWADTDEIRPNYEALDNRGTINLPGSSILTSPFGTTIATPANEQEATPDEVVNDVAPAVAWYVDQILPFDIVLGANNEYGASAEMRILGVELLNHGQGFSVDDAVLESQTTYIARSLIPWRPLSRSAVSGNTSDQTTTQDPAFSGSTAGGGFGPV